MPRKMYLKLDTINGDCTDERHRDEIVVTAWAWGVYATNLAAADDGPSGAARPNFQPLTLTKWVDIASPKLMLASCTGRQIQKAVLEIIGGRADRGETIKVTLEDVLVNSVIIDRSEGEPRFKENISLKGTKVHFEYKNASEGHVNAHDSFGWNITTNRAIQ